MGLREFQLLWYSFVIKSALAFEWEMEVKERLKGFLLSIYPIFG
jgi:hypothetical protein